MVHGLLKLYGELVGVRGLHRKGGGKWGCGGVWNGKWAMWITKFNETWWTMGHEMFCAHEKKGLLRMQL
jgi:hypothetical protein